MKKKLYARDSKGKILEWSVATEQLGLDTSIRISYGEFDGAKAITWRNKIQGKNIGKANETSGEEQAENDCVSLIKRQKDKGYIELDVVISGSLLLTKEALEAVLPKYRRDASGNIKPMKAQQYYRSKKNWTAPDGSVWDDRKYYYIKNPHTIKETNAIVTKFPCMAQPKINGVRALIIKEENNYIIKSKEGLIYDLPHITNYLKSKDLQNFIDVLDGEIYLHGESLQTISSAVKKPNLQTGYLKFIMFDLAIEEETNVERWNKLKEFATLVNDINSPFELITTALITSDARAQQFTDINIEKGYEGTIFRDTNATYKFGSRPVTMTKLKRALDAEFKIVNVLPQEKDNTKANFECITKEGEKFLVDPKGTDEYKRNLLISANEIIGKNLTLTFYEYTDLGKPLHILEAIIRDYE